MVDCWSIWQAELAACHVDHLSTLYRLEGGSGGLVLYYCCIIEIPTPPLHVSAWQIFHNTNKNVILHVQLWVGMEEALPTSEERPLIDPKMFSHPKRGCRILCGGTMVVLYGTNIYLFTYLMTKPSYIRKDKTEKLQIAFTNSTNTLLVVVTKWEYSRVYKRSELI